MVLGVVRLSCGAGGHDIVLWCWGLCDCLVVLGVVRLSCGAGGS